MGAGVGRDISAVRPDPHPTRLVARSGTVSQTPLAVTVPAARRPAIGADLVLDVGTTMTKAALVRDGDVTRLDAFPTGPDGWPARLAALLERAGPVDQVAVSSVAPAVTAALRACGGVRRPGAPVRFVSAATAPLVIDYRPATSLGTDRIAAAVAARAGWGAAVVVVDVGTAITCDAVDAAGRFVGGAIAPGPATGYRGLLARAPHLAPASDPLAGDAGRPPTAGTSTADCLRAGVVRGTAALVDGLVRDLHRLVGRCPVVATGGLAGVVAPASDEIAAVDPDLTLRGIHLACRTGCSLTPPRGR